MSFIEWWNIFFIHLNCARTYGQTNGFSPKNVGTFMFLAITLAKIWLDLISFHILIEDILCYQIVLRIISRYLLTLDLWPFIPNTVRFSTVRFSKHRSKNDSRRKGIGKECILYLEIYSFLSIALNRLAGINFGTALHQWRSLNLLGKWYVVPPCFNQILQCISYI
jgi:hypothetical protein